MLSCGSCIIGSIYKVGSRGITLSTSLGNLTVPYNGISQILVYGGRWAYLDELKPLECIERSFVGPVVWHYKVGANCLGDPLTIRAVRYRRGLGVHSYCKLAYALQGKYERFEALIGLDDAAVDERFDTRFGNVIFNVYLDGKRIFTSGPISWNDEPREVRLEVKAARRLELEVSEGKGFHIRDRADWIEPRLLKLPQTLP